MLLKTLDEVGDILSRSLAQNGLVLQEREIAPEFFDLRTRIAGELFQKIVNYGSHLAIVVTDPRHYGARFSELVYEHQRHPNIRFFETLDGAQAWLTEVR
ncbi:MAG: DUF4180 domain-containing protein [Gammaproteobacteria bacterium]|nr:DUF4180 domain-containing protein [Pseudomonadales bacterium]MCP5347572.1 DUF4180 domain-containing protein [Pseudomonadales bacterium]